MSRQYVHEENITIPQGTDFFDVITVSQKNGDAMDLSEFSSFAGKMRRNFAYYASTSGTDFTIVATDSSNGKLRISVASSATQDLRPGFWVYEITGFATSGDYLRLSEGKVNLTGRVY